MSTASTAPDVSDVWGCLTGRTNARNQLVNHRFVDVEFRHNLDLKRRCVWRYEYLEAASVLDADSDLSNVPSARSPGVPRREHSGRLVLLAVPITRSRFAP